MLVVVGCGSKTGLGLPDADAPPPRGELLADGAVPIDAAAPDAGLPEPVCIELPRDGSPVRASFTLPVALSVVDVLFLLDSSGSMADEIDNVRERLRGVVVPGVRAAIPDAAFGVALLGEFPVEPHGPEDVRPYVLRTPITRDTLQVEGALERVPEWGNFDEPEAQVEALYQVATGEGLAPWIEPSFGCPGGGMGGVCFRRDSLPVVMLITDAPFHNGPGGAFPYTFRPAPHRYPSAVGALRDVGALVIGLGATDAGALSPMTHLREIARDTGAVAESGPLAFDIGSSGTGVGQGVVEAVERLAAGVRLDVSARVQDAAGDAYDAREQVEAVRAVGADPPDAVREMREDRFVGVLPGTEVTFEIAVTAEGLDIGAETVRIPAEVVFRAFGRSRIGEQLVELVIPAAGSAGCD